ncbi:hypothetical protein MHYP_G00197070 [Metynnis hypsauchen]
MLPCVRSSPTLSYVGSSGVITSKRKVWTEGVNSIFVPLWHQRKLVFKASECSLFPRLPALRRKRGACLLFSLFPAQTLSLL